MKGKNILITGGAGFIGSNLVERLASDNVILVMDNLHTGFVSNLEEFMDKIQLKVMDIEDIFEVDFRPDIIFHLGMYSSTPMYKENRSLVHKVVDGTMKVLEFAKRNDSRVVVASSSSVYNGHTTPQHEDMVPLITDFYTEARLSAERLTILYTKMFELEATCLRFFSVYGPREKSKGKYANLVSQFIWDLQEGRPPIIYGDGTQTRDFIYVKDVVEACVLAADSARKGIYNVGTGRSYSINQMAQKVMDTVGIHLEPSYTPILVKNYVLHTLADTSKAKRELGFEAKYTLDDGLKMMLSERGIKEGL
jgi:UDP-glucose 4-epimerase